MNTVSSMGKAWGGVEPGKGRQRRNMGHICNIKFLREDLELDCLELYSSVQLPVGKHCQCQLLQQSGQLYSIPSSSRPASYYSSFTLLSLTFAGEVINLRPRAVKTSTFAYDYWTRVENFLQSMADTFLRPCLDTHSAPDTVVPHWIIQMLSCIPGHFSIYIW